MSTYGYIRKTADENYTHLQMEHVVQYECDHLYLEVSSSGKDSSVELLKLLKELKKEDAVVVYNFDCFGKNIIQLREVTDQISTIGAKLVILDSEIDTSEDKHSELFETISLLSKMEQNIIKEYTVRGLNAARKKGIVGGRPQVNQEKVNEAIDLYLDYKYSFRRIAEETGLSIGTISKYVKLYEKGEWPKKEVATVKKAETTN